MKLGIFSDLHSNIYALNAMLRQAPVVSEWICLGDFTGLFPGVNEVVGKLKDSGITAIRGDHEMALLGEERINNSVTAQDAICRQQEEILPAHRAYIRDLGDTADLEIDGLRIHATHRLIRGDQGPSAKFQIDLAELDQRFRAYDVLLFGHTHFPLTCYCPKVILVNPGSAGFPIDCTRMASFAVLDTVTREVQLQRFSFETDALLHDIKAFGYHQKLYDYVKNGFYWG